MVKSANMVSCVDTLSQSLNSCKPYIKKLGEEAGKSLQTETTSTTKELSTGDVLKAVLKIFPPLKNVKLADYVSEFFPKVRESHENLIKFLAHAGNTCAEKPRTITETYQKLHPNEIVDELSAGWKIFQKHIPKPGETPIPKKQIFNLKTNTWEPVIEKVKKEAVKTAEKTT